MDSFDFKFKPVSQVALVGSLHGNELIGGHLVRKWQTSPNLVLRTTFESIALIGNPLAFSKKMRFVDRNLNNAFKLDDPLCLAYAYELERARTLEQRLSSSDFILDIHSTNSNMGITLILDSIRDVFSLMLAAIVSKSQSGIRIVSLEKPDHNGILSGRRGMALEIGPIAHGTLSATLFQRAETLVYSILDLIELWNKNGMVCDVSGEELSIEKTEVTIYKIQKEIQFSQEKIEGNHFLTTMISPDLEGKDWFPVEDGTPLMVDMFNKPVVYHQGERAFPIFIGEAAYYERSGAMFLVKECKIFPTYM